MKAIFIVIVGTLFVASGCQSSLVLGPKANEDGVLGATAGSEGASLTLPFVKSTVGPTETSNKKE